MKGNHSINSQNYYEKFHTRLNRFPQSKILQKNAQICILQPTSENEGLYRCVDHASRNTLDFVYYLIAMQPMFIYLK